MAKKKKKRRRGRKALVIILLLAAVSAAVYLGYTYVRADNILVNGNLRKADEEIVALSGITAGEHILMVDKARAETGINSDPYLVYEGIEVSLPNTITINVRERTPAAVIVHGDKLVTIDDEGYILSIQTSAGEPDCPLVTGLVVTGYELGSRIKVDELFTLEAMHLLLDELYGCHMEEVVTGVDITDVNDLKLETIGGVTIKLGSVENMDTKIPLAKSVLDWLEQQGSAGGVIDLTTGEFGTYSPDGSMPQGTDGPDEPPVETGGPDDEQD